MVVTVPEVPKLTGETYEIRVSREHNRVFVGVGTAQGTNIAQWSAITYLVESMVPGCEHRPDIWYFGEGKRRLVMSREALKSVGWTNYVNMDLSGINLVADVERGPNKIPKGYHGLFSGASDDYLIILHDLKLVIQTHHKTLENWYRDGLVLPI
jgi:hypothetical protein